MVSILWTEHAIWKAFEHSYEATFKQDKDFLDEVDFFQATISCCALSILQGRRSGWTGSFKRINTGFKGSTQGRLPGGALHQARKTRTFFEFVFCCAFRCFSQSFFVRAVLAKVTSDGASERARE